MDTLKKTDQKKDIIYIPQMQVRSNVCSGGDIETCLFNLNKWRDRYYYWQNEAKKQGKI
jgi:hypothetical protein